MPVTGSQVKTKARGSLSGVRGRLGAGRRVARERAPSASLPPALFAFTGGHAARSGTSGELYRAEPVFRESVDACAAVLAPRFALHVAESFRGGGEPHGEDGALELAWLAVLQIGLCDLWRSVGVTPAAALGVGIGEVAAAYAARVLSREDASTVAGAFARRVAQHGEPATVFCVDLDDEAARMLCAAAPGELRLLGSLTPGRSRMWSPAGDAAAVGAFLRERGAWAGESPAASAEHTPFASDLPGLQADLSGVTPHPPECPLLSAAAGGELRAARFDATHWDWVASRHFLLSGAAILAVNLAPELVVRLGADAEQSRSLDAAAGELGVSPALVDTLRAGEDELTAWRAALGAVEAVRARSAAPRAPEPGASEPASGPPASPPTATAPALAGADPVTATGEPRSASATLQLHAPSPAQDPFADPFAAYEALRREGPVRYVSTQKAWLVLGHREVVAALSKPQLYSSRLIAPVDPVLLGSDGRPHAQVRRALTGSFSAEAIERLVPEIDAVAAGLLRPLVETGELDVARQFASPLSSYVGARLLELDAESAAAVTAAVGNGEAEPVTLFDRLAGLAELLRERSGLVAKLRERRELDDDQLRSLLRLLWAASTATTKRVMVAAVRVLTEDLPLRRRLIDDPSQLGAFVEEVVRLNPAEHFAQRVATQDVVLGGTAIREGSVVKLCLAAANRDPLRFDRPAEFRLDRTQSHVAFGSGSHGCPGANLARAEIRSAITALLHLAPDFTSPQPRCMLRHLPETHGLEQLVIARDRGPHGSRRGSPA